MSDIVLDSNAFILYIVGRINPETISFHKRTSLYTAEDFYYLQELISNYDRIITCPNVLTEVDNLLAIANYVISQNRWIFRCLT